MSSSRPAQSRFTSVTIENFRGVRDAQTFDLDAAVVIFWGPNGTGKTTAFDALLWLMQGSLPRLASHSLRRNEEFVVSAYGSGRVARVTAKLSVAGDLVEISRQGDTKSSSLTLTLQGQPDLGGVDAEEKLHRLLSEGDLPLPEMLATSGLLQQDDLRQLLRDKPDARYRQLLRLLGLESLEQFEKFVESEYKLARATMQSAKLELDKQRVRLRDLGEQVSTVLSLSASSTSQPSELEALESSVGRTSQALEVQWPSSSASDLGAITDEATEAGERVERVSGNLQRLPKDLPPLDEPDPNLADALAKALERHTAAKAALSNARFRRDSQSASHDQIVALVAAAIPLLEAHTHEGKAECPVCRTVIDSRQVIADLANRSESGSLLAEAESMYRAASERLAQAELILVEARGATEAADQSRRTRVAYEQLAFQIAGDLRLLASGGIVRARFIRSLEIPESGPSLVPWLDHHREILLDGLRDCSAALVDLISASTSASRRANAREDSINRSGQLPRLEALREVFSAELVEKQESYESARKVETAANSLRHSTAAGTEEIFRERFEFIEPLMNDIYGRLDPHPTFTKLDFAIERYRSKGTAMASVTDESADVQANPLLVFSSAQANVVVLSAFLALGWAASRQGLPFVLMDDPLQSLDDVNVLGFADLVKQLRGEKQVFLSTHEERFARLLERKLSPLRVDEEVVVHRFLSWSREGPKVDSRRLSVPDEYVDHIAS